MEFIRKSYQTISVAIIICILVAGVFFGFKKQGFYIDEYYLYTFANGTQAGIAITPGEWNDTSDYVSQLVSEGDENFRYKQATENIKNGVHPPLYYYLVHFISSIFSGVFSKWIGITINLFLLIPILILVKKFALKLTGGNEVVTLITLVLFGLSPATISMVVLVRMYLLLSLWTLLYAYICVSDIEREGTSVRRLLLPVFICGFIGFLTQYFFVIVMFFFTFVYAFYLVFSCRRIKKAIIFGTTALISLICTYFVWPVSVFHIFKGHRGKGAISQATDVSHMADRFVECNGYMNKLVFGRLLPIFILMFVCGVFLIVKRCIGLHKEGNKKILCTLSYPTRAFVMVLISSVLTYLTLTQVGLLDGGITSSRQFYSAYALFMVMIPVGIFRLIKYFTKNSGTIGITVTAVLVCVILISGHYSKSVLYLYESDKVATTFAREHPDMKVVMFENGNYDSVIQELIMYPRIYYVSYEDLSQAEDDEIANADELLVYVYNNEYNRNECFDSIFRQNNKLGTTEHLWDSGFYSAYLMY